MLSDHINKYPILNWEAHGGRNHMVMNAILKIGHAKESPIIENLFEISTLIFLQRASASKSLAATYNRLPAVN
jgi:hypothetical protein